MSEHDQPSTDAPELLHLTLKVNGEAVAVSFEPFKTLLVKADQWASIDVEEYTDSLPVSDGPKGRISRAIRLSATLPQ